MQSKVSSSNWQDLLQNKQFWGVVVAVVAVGAKAAGFEIDQTGLVNNLVALSGVVFTLYGTVTSTKSIKSVAGVKVNKNRADHPDNAAKQKGGTKNA